MQGSAEQKAPAALNLRFTTLYTFPPLYTQKPAARRVFVFVGDSTLRAAAFGCDPARENAIPESPQTFRACSISKYYSADDSRSTAEAI